MIDLSKARRPMPSSTPQSRNELQWQVDNLRAELAGLTKRMERQEAHIHHVEAPSHTSTPVYPISNDE